MIDAFGKGPALNYPTLRAQEFRAMFDVPAPLAQIEDAVKIEQRTVEFPGGSVRVKIYHPEGDGHFPITLYIHGGGFVVGTPETTDGICRTLAAKARSLIVSPDYRLAPEEPFPAGLEDCWATLQWALHNATALGGIAERVAVAGDSSGGNFAAVIAQMARNCGLTLQHQLLLYPVLDHDFETPSYSDFAQGYFLTSEMMRWFWSQYLPAHAEDNDWRISPLRQEILEGLPAATIITAEYDVLRDEAEAFACRLILSGVPTAVRRYKGQIHGFLLQQGTIDDADAALCAAAKALRSALHA
ncbi:alpha/beta hydrolase [Azospirillum endophyticum]